MDNGCVHYFIVYLYHSLPNIVNVEDYSHKLDEVSSSIEAWVKGNDPCTDSSRGKKCFLTLGEFQAEHLWILKKYLIMELSLHNSAWI